MHADWRQLASDRKQKQIDSIPKEWLISPPPDSILDVLQFPETCGLLTDKEIQITSITDVDSLLHNIASGVWSSVEVTTAFAKRAIIAHQLVGRHATTVSFMD